jgi:hypothetical protein
MPAIIRVRYYVKIAIPGGLSQTGMYGPLPCRKRKMKVTGWSAQMYSAFIGAQSSWPLMECAAALVLSSNAALGGCSGLQVATFANPQ